MKAVQAKRRKDSSNFQTKTGMDVSCFNREEWMSVVHHVETVMDVGCSP